MIPTEINGPQASMNLLGLTETSGLGTRRLSDLNVIWLSTLSDHNFLDSSPLRLSLNTRFSGIRIKGTGHRVPTPIILIYQSKKKIHY